jgi:hypothetical protein
VEELSCPYIYDKSLFFVSIVLLEGTKPFPREKYITKGMAEFVAAKQLIEELDNEPGEAALFTEAVHRCSWGVRLQLHRFNRRVF